MKLKRSALTVFIFAVCYVIVHRLLFGADFNLAEQGTIGIFAGLVYVVVENRMLKFIRGLGSSTGN